MQGKHCVITGAASGIGRACAVAFAGEGARVIVADIDADAGRETVRLASVDGGAAEFIQTDVTVRADIERAIAAAIADGGRLDVMFNNVGGSVSGGHPLGDTSEDEWDRTIALNLKSVYLGCHLALPIMIRQGGGVIINTGSTSGLVGRPGRAAYVAAKGGVVQVTRSMAVDYGKHGIRVNCICPGAVRTPLIERNMQHRPDPERWFRENAEGRPLARWAEPEEIAGAAVYLASDESSFVTGAIFVVDGGLTAQ